MARLSLVASVLDSHEVVRRQLIYLDRWLPNSCELVLIDDGSDPPLRHVLRSTPVRFSLTWCPTRDVRPWTQPRGRNIGARIASADVILFFDIDHILTEQLIDTALSFEGDKFHWNRKPGVLDECGTLVTDEQVLRRYGWDERPCGVSANMYVIRREVFEGLGGYDERFCGSYGGDDIDFDNRYCELAKQGKAQPVIVLGEAFVFPDPSSDRLGIFHRLPRI